MPIFQLSKERLRLDSATLLLLSIRLAPSSGWLFDVLFKNIKKTLNLVDQMSLVGIFLLLIEIRPDNQGSKDIFKDEVVILMLILAFWFQFISKL